MHQSLLKVTFFEKLFSFLSNEQKRDHPFKTSAFVRGVGVKDFPNLPMEGVAQWDMDGK